MTYLTVALNASHQKAGFLCGRQILDDYLHKQAKQDVKRKLSACFVLVDADAVTIKGYYTLSSASVARHLLPENIIKKLPPSYTDLPTTLLGRLAVGNKYKNQGLGELLLIDALKRSYDISVSIGSIAVITDPIDENTSGFYKKYGFITLPGSGKMFIPMNTIAALF